MKLFECYKISKINILSIFYNSTDRASDCYNMELRASHDVDTHIHAHARAHTRTQSDKRWRFRLRKQYSSRFDFCRRYD